MGRGVSTAHNENYYARWRFTADTNPASREKGE